MTESVRETQARERYDAAVAAERRARVTAAPALRARARRRRAALRLAGVAAVIVSVVALCIGSWGFASADDVDTDRAVDAAVAAVTTMVTPDPADPEQYVDEMSDDSTGDQRKRFDASRDALIAYVKALEVAPDGRVVSAGVESSSDDAVEVLLVAQAADPSLVGGAPGTNRVTVLVRMVSDGDRWLVADTKALP